MGSTKYISIPLDLLMALREGVVDLPELTDRVDAILDGNIERISRRLREQDARKVTWAYKSHFAKFRVMRHDLTEAQARHAFKTSNDYHRRVAEAYEALLAGQSGGR